MSISPLTFAAVILLTAVVASALTAIWFRKHAATSAPPQQPIRPLEQVRSPVHPQQSFLGPDFRPVGLRFSTSKGSSPIMEISALRGGALPAGRQRLDPSNARLSVFGQFLQSIPSVLTAADFGRGNYMQVLVHGHIALASEPQSFAAFVLGDRGQVEELGQLKNSDLLQQSISNGMGWQLAFIAVAQKHLADLQKKLDYVRTGVEEVREFFTKERRSKIAGTLDYLRQVVKTLGQKESPVALRNQLENIERELLQVQDLVMRDLRASADKIGTSAQGRFERRQTRIRNIQESAAGMYDLEREWLLCMVARAVNWQVLSVFPGDKQFKIARRGSIYKSLDEFTELLGNVYGRLYEKTAEVKSVLDSIWSAQQDKSLLAQYDLRRRLIEENQHASSDAHVIREEVRKFADRLWSPQKPTVLALRLDRSRIVEAYEIGQG